jgi:hypothetical protein
MSPALQETSDNQTIEKTAELERESLDIVKQCRESKDLIEYEAFSHSSPSEKAHSLTCTVSLFFLYIIFFIIIPYFVLLKNSALYRL